MRWLLSHRSSYAISPKRPGRLGARRMQAVEPHKRMTLPVALLSIQAARALDDLGEMFVRRMQHIDDAAKLAPDRNRAALLSSAPTISSPRCTSCYSRTRRKARSKSASRQWTR